ncbi:MAG: sigma-54-dependent Fis family transcriptional regulator [Nitrospirae bacterium]|nr:sigma-54-dependent Fis family transcriptional regulator [Nitrospirota bacterium]
MSKSILIVEDEETLRESVKRIFTKEGYLVEAVESAERGLALLESTLFDVIISDIILPGMDGIEMLTKVREQLPDQIFIVVTAYASLDTSVKALRAGAYDYIMKPIIHDEIKQVVKNALKQKSLQAENILLKREIAKEHDFSTIIGESQALKSILAEVRKVTDTRSNVLLLGETGTGKELFARVIHHNSSRRDMPFVPINCSAIPENLLETELFGHVRGAFTGAVASKKGLLEEADGGTVFLDEIGDMSLPLQAKLLRVIEDQVIRPVGSTKGTKIDIRFITATNRDLRAAVRENAFREDLYYRINVISLQIPPLRDRKEDIRSLVRHYLDKYTHEMGKQVKDIAPAALDVMANYLWPGNVRELQNVVERAILIADGDTITPECLPEGIKGDGTFQEAAFEKKLTIEDYTKAFIQRHQTQFNEQQIADMLGITRKSLWEKRKKWGIPRER